MHPQAGFDHVRQGGEVNTLAHRLACQIASDAGYGYWQRVRLQAALSDRRKLSARLRDLESVLARNERKTWWKRVMEGWGM